MRDYDVIVIGSGAGGLTAAVALANAGKRVLVLEQHYMAGGWTQSFVLDGFRYSPGVHYLGELGPGGNYRQILEGLGLSRDIEFCQLNEDGYDHYIVAGERFDAPVGAERYEMRLKERFPEEAKGIAAYFDLVKKVTADLDTASRYSSGLKALQLPFRAPNLIFRGLGLLGTWFDKNISNPILRGYLTALAGDYAVPADEAPFALHAAVTGHYFDGGYYPRGGAHRLPRAYIKQLKRKGGSIRLSTPVKRILLEAGRAVGVETASGERFTAERVISNADADVTLRRLIGVEHLGRRLRRKLDRTEYSLGSLGLFLATDLDLKSMGYDSGNYWWYKTTDIDAMYRGQMPEPGQEFPACFLTITTLKDPSKRKDGLHTIEVFSFLPYDVFSKWSHRPYGDRGEEYETYKAQLSTQLLRTAENIIPGLGDHLVYNDAATPLSNEHYAFATRGSVYGPTKSRKQLGPGSYPIKTEIPGLYMVGQSTLSHGVLGVTLTGLMAAKSILRCGMGDLFTEKGPDLVTYPAERPEEWMDDLRKRRNRAAERPTGRRAA